MSVKITCEEKERTTVAIRGKIQRSSSLKSGACGQRCQPKKRLNVLIGENDDFGKEEVELGKAVTCMIDHYGTMPMRRI